MPCTPLPAQPLSSPRSGNAEATTSSARRALEPQSPSKRPREAGETSREAGETSRALVLVGEEVGGAVRAAAASPKRPRVRPGTGLPCKWCGEVLPGHARRCAPWSQVDEDHNINCAPSAEALAIAGWQHDRQP